MRLPEQLEGAPAPRLREVILNPETSSKDPVKAPRAASGVVVLFPAEMTPGLSGIYDIRTPINFLHSPQGKLPCREWL